MGQSWQRWEGDTLVLKASQFYPPQSIRGATQHQLDVGLDSRVTECFMRLGEKDIHYEFTVEDEKFIASHGAANSFLDRLMAKYTSTPATKVTMV
jgi:hypothetical protein